MTFYAFQKGFTGYTYIAEVQASSLGHAKKKLAQSGYTGKFLLVPPQNIVELTAQSNP